MPPSDAWREALRADMFKEACELLAKQVRPIFVVTRHGDRPPRFAVGASVVINDHGWTLTAAHVVRAAMEALEAQREFDGLPLREQRAIIDGTEPTVTRAGVRWGSWDNPPTPATFALHATADLALFQLADLRLPDGYRRPVFRSDVAPGESVCRVGYSLLDDVSATFQGDEVRLDQRPPLFVNDGIVTRYVDYSGNRHVEVSSPGLLGQSGGPLADREARVCGIQVRTRHYRLGFGGEDASYHVGQAVNADVVRRFLDDHNVDYEASAR